MDNGPCFAVLTKKYLQVHACTSLDSLERTNIPRVSARISTQFHHPKFQWTFKTRPNKKTRSLFFTTHHKTEKRELLAQNLN